MTRISKAEVEVLLKSKLKLKGNTSPLAALILQVAGHACDASTVVGLIEVLQASKIVQIATSSVVNVVGALLLIPAWLIELKNASEWGERQAGLVGVAWGTVAWAYGDSMPKGPKDAVGGSEAHKLEKAYRSAFKARCTELDGIVKKSKIKGAHAKKAHQLALRLAGKNSRQGLWAHMSKGIEKKLSGVPLATWPLIHKYNRYPTGP